jgi:hypothetical protein
MESMRLMSIARLMAVSCTVALFWRPAFGCFCFSTPMCEQVGPTLAGSAVFVGRVVEVWPTQSTLSHEFQHASLVSLRRLLLSRWRGVLSPEDERYIRTKDKSYLEVRYAFMQRVRFKATEVFAGSGTEEIYTDCSSCGYRFQVGHVYLVNASRGGRRYWTGACFRTGPVESREAIEDLKALRAWKSGTPLAARVYGHIPHDDLRGDVRVSLVNERGRKLADPTFDGAFSFDDLDRTEYRLQVEDGRGKGERLIDLSRVRCFEAMPWFSGEWHIAGTPVQMDRSSSPRQRWKNRP